MATTSAVIYDDVFLLHKTSPWHPERPERLKAIMKSSYMKALVQNKHADIVKPEEGDVLELVERVHDVSYIEFVRKLCERNGGYIDSDTPVSRESYHVALKAVSGIKRACNLILDNDYKRVFVLARPPGHHAGHSGKTPNAPSQGFCIFNNVALAADYLLSRGVRRCLIVDFDAHHGNGTQEIFYETSRILFVSIHQDGRTLYPGTGFIDEIGEGEGRGYNINVPLPPYTGDDVYESVFQEIIEPIAESYKPEFILVSAGFDGHYADQMSSLRLSNRGYCSIMRRLLSISRKYCTDRIIAVLEGGYNLDILAVIVPSLIALMSGLEPSINEESTKSPENVLKYSAKIIEKIKELIEKYHVTR